MDPTALLRDGGPYGLLVTLATAALLYLRDRIKRLETQLEAKDQELREARRLHLSDLRKVRSRGESESPPSQ